MTNRTMLLAATVAIGCSSSGPASQTAPSPQGGTIATEEADVARPNDDGVMPTRDADSRRRRQRCYSVHLLGTLGGTNSSAIGINERGEVVGTADTAAGESHAFLWKDGELEDLKTLGGPSSTASAINDRAIVVGTSTLADGTPHAFLWRNGRMADLGTLPGEAESAAVSINEGGEVVGNAGSDKAFVWEHGRMRPLPPLAGGFARSFFISRTGRIFGLSNGFDQDFFSVVEWHHDRIATIIVGAVIYGASNRGVVGDPVIPGGSPYIWLDGELTLVAFDPFAINDRGQVVGESGSGPVLWDHGEVTELGGGPIEAAAFQSTNAHLINDRGDVVVGRRVWSGGVLTELPTPDGPASSELVPTAIDDAGEIVGDATYDANPTETRAALLWRPSRCGCSTGPFNVVR